MNLLRFCEDKELKRLNPVGLINTRKSVKPIIFYIGKNKFIDKISTIKIDCNWRLKTTPNLIKE